MTARDQRRDEILDTAARVLAEKGYRDMSMLEIARRASASKETLYAWFGDKQGLLEALIARNAGRVQQVMTQHLDDEATPAGTSPDHLLLEFGQALLDLLLGESAVAINRAAISEAKADPALARLLTKAGRDSVLPGFVRLLERHRTRGTLAFDDPSRAAEDFLGLLLGDCQIRRLLGVLPPPRKAQIAARAARATETFLQLYKAGR